MVARGAGDVGCAHCTLIGADRACQLCTRMVCEKCAADWTTCSEPSGRVVRLGLTARLRDVDPAGRLGLVSHWRQSLRIFDLRRLRWIKDVRIKRGIYVQNRRYPPRLTADHRVIYPDWSAYSGGQGGFFGGIRIASLRGERNTLVAPSDRPARGTESSESRDIYYYMTTEAGDVVAASDPPVRGSAVSDSGDIYYYVTQTERVAVVAGADSYVVEPMPRKVLHAVHVDGERELLAAGSWSEVVLCGLSGGRLTHHGHRKTEAAGDVRWIAIAGPWLVAAIRVLNNEMTDTTITFYPSTSRIEVYPLEGDLKIGPLARVFAVEHFRAASLSSDGRYLAFADDDVLHVHDLTTDTMTEFTEHTDAINLVRFVGADHLLVSADTDNRVVLRPRTPAGYARPLIAIDVPDEGVELPPLDTDPVAVA